MLGATMNSSQTTAPPHVLVVCGPTATGKSELGVALAERVGGEVISADSMQLYAGMDIGTGKLPDAERRGVPHHLLDIWDITETADVARYQQLARERVHDVADRGLIPIVVGGSGLYVDAVVLDWRFPGTDPMVRARWQEFADVHGSAAAHRELADRDPVAAAAILPTNTRRIVRALEVIELTGEPFTATLPRRNDYFAHTRLGWQPEHQHDAAIADRVDGMLADGWLDEVRRLEGAGLRRGRTASRALGYQQLLAHLDGEITLQAAREQTVVATCKFARRQRKWFAQDDRMHWLTSPDPADRLDEALQVWSARSAQANPA